MAAKNLEDYNFKWLSGCVEEWLLKSGEKNGFSLKENKNNRVFITCPGSFGEVYIELNDQGLSLWSEQASLQTLIQNSRILDMLEGSQSGPLNPVPALELFATCVAEDQKSEQSTDLDELSDEDNQPDDNNASEDDLADDELDYYGADDLIDEQPEEVVKEKQKEPDDGPTADQFFTGDGSPMAIQRLLLDLKNMNKIGTKYGFNGVPRGDNLFLWDVKLMDFEKGTKLAKDIQRWAKAAKREECIYMEMKFPKEYPMLPPFVRILRPRFQFLTGHITIGGSICMQVLTRSGWQPTNDIESVLVQIRAQISADPNASLNVGDNSDYNESEARSAFERMCNRYGWKN